MKYDVIIIGAGIIGLTIAYELKRKSPDLRILILEKEAQIGLHASGRNSGVLHSGIYYPAGSLKAKFCAEGARAMADFCHQYGLPIQKLGKVIVPTTEAQDSVLDELLVRAYRNGAKATLISQKDLKEIEPHTRTASGRALYVPDTAVVDSKAILNQLYKLLTAQGVEVRFKSNLISVDAEQSKLFVNDNWVHYRTLYNAAGQYADKVAHRFGVGEAYTLLPFKGLYQKLAKESGITCRGLIYPVPDLNMPFLGVHVTKSIGGDIYLGPTSVPALGREHYQGLSGISPSESVKFLYYLSEQYVLDHQNFRNFTHQEAFRFFKKYFTEAVQALLPTLKPQDLLACTKVGIRPQLFNLKKRALEMDFLVERKDDTVHVLNAISPAFTSSMSFARHLVL